MWFTIITELMFWTSFPVTASEDTFCDQSDNSIKRKKKNNLCHVVRAKICL